MRDYIKEIRQQLITKYGFEEDPKWPGCPMDVPNGDYPMEIEGKLDNVHIVDSTISCYNFKKEP